MLINVTEKGRRGKRGRETSIGCLLYMPQPGTEPVSQACAPTWDGTHDFLVYGTTLQSTEPHWPGLTFVIIIHAPKLQFKNTRVLF